METDKFKKALVDITYTCYTLLFLYAATSKLIGYASFKLQLGQSPVISSFSVTLSWAVPALEILIAVLMLTEKFRTYALFGGYTLMCLFTAYIYIIINYSSYVPCSCGGVLENLSWNQHLIFNMTFMSMAIAAIIFSTDPKTHIVMKTRNNIIMLFTCTILSCVSMLALFLASQNQMRYRNSLARLFPPGLAEQENTAHLKFNSYYFAGSEDGYIYLGNSTAPLLVTVLDSTLTVHSVHHIKIDKETMGMSAPQIRIDPPYFYLCEGSVPYIYKGSVSDWKAELQAYTGNYFSQLLPISKTKVIARFTDAQATKNALGVADLQNSKLLLSPELLSSGGLFATDGLLLFDKSENKIAYVHYYSNKILITDNSLNTLLVSKTIDTLESPELKITTVNNERTFSEMPVLANRIAHFDSGWLYVNSQIIGQNEPKERWDTSSIIDIYESSNGGYMASFYVDDIDEKKARSFWADGDNVYVLGGSKIIRYRLRKFLAR